MRNLGKKCTFTAIGQRIVDVTCERCGTAFRYLLFRQAEGTAIAWPLADEAPAQRLAETRARRALARRLETESDPVPCPKCHWINRELIDGYRKTRYRGLPASGAVTAIFVWIAAFALCLEDAALEPRGPGPYTILAEAIAGALGGMLCIAGGMAMQSILRRRIDPNLHYPAPPILPPATPKGWTPHDLAAPPRFEPGSFDPTAGESRYPGWAVFRKGYEVIPPICCECLAPTDRPYKDKFGPDDRPSVEVRLCDECASRLRNNWWLAAIAVIFLVAMGCMAIIAFSHGKRASLVIPIICMGVFYAAFGALTLPAIIACPYHLRVVDSSRGIMRVKFRNEQFTEMVRQASADAERAAIQPPP
ncbi:MAG TPA: hypothetical protein VHY37_07795 [Tepidisphaeraceae bacterium]|jgi:hypothetical protein|nr:hypothetical protein [Tepidisphaeraceae bacterium]